ncbi:MAG: cyclic pyranopterin monophosphate synthase MoaC [Hydrogenobacter sp.]|uniref:cyclic pyranopterin monophosphate synthase MoaC n=1 Tax=Hydrogenobacter thermophilus TaxID=940 RepID=UPI0030F80812
MRTVDVSSKPLTLRTAKAYGRIRLKPQTVKAILEGKIPKGDVLQACKLAGITGAKKTHELLPFCHPLIFQHAQMELQVKEDLIEVYSFVKGIERTGYEMEALTAVMASLLTIYDMCKGLDDSMIIEEVKLLEKSGGKSQWEKMLKGKSVLVLVQREFFDLIANYLKNLDPERLITTDEGQVCHLLISTYEVSLKEEFYALNTVVNQTLFSLLPSRVRKGALLGKDEKGRTVIWLEPSKEVISAFFENFSHLLGAWVDE